MNEEAITFESPIDEAQTDMPIEAVEPIPTTVPEDSIIEGNEESETVAQLLDTISSLKGRISELERTRDSQEKMLGQLSDFVELFPSVNIDSIPESVWNSVKSGTSLAAAYALYEKRVAAENMRIEKINSLNSLKSAGAAGKNTAAEFFTPDDVRKMSPAEVRANFSKIKKSMTKWN